MKIKKLPTRGGTFFVALITLMVATSQTLDANQITQRLESIVLDTFDNPEERSWIETGVEKRERRIWVARGSRFTREGFPRLTYADAWPTALFDTNPENLPLKVLGINGRFNRTGFNYIELFPAIRNDDGEIVPQPIRLPGIAKSLDIWVWGSNYDFTMEIHIRDSRGVPYVLNLGSIKFKGWRNLGVTIPSSIPQTQAYLPSYLGLTLTKIVIRTNPGERVDNFFVYLDNLKVLTDMYTEAFDGRDLARPEVTNRIWSEQESR